MIGSAVPKDAPATVAEPTIATRGITKSFFGARALDGIDFTVARGEVHGLIGKNGAGKSTFLKILSGAQPPDSGEIAVGGRTVAALTPMTARAAGIAVVYQNPELHLDLSVAANIYLGAEPRTRLRLADDAAMLRAAAALVARLGLSLDVSRRLGDLDIADRQQVAIAKAVREEASVLLLDEPTSALNKSQTKFLFQLIRDLARSGMAIVYISHHLDEVLAIADRITAPRNARQVNVVDARNVDKDGLIAMIVGRAEDSAAPRRGPLVSAEPLLTVRSISLPGRLSDVSFSLAAGEILGLTGLTGAGARAVAAAVGGIEPVSGEMTLAGARYAPRAVHEAIAAGVVYAPEDMRTRGLVMQLSTGANMTLAGLGALAKRCWLDLKREAGDAADLTVRLDIMPRDPEREVRFLSGGNQRKALLGRAIFATAKVLVLEEPTQGVDVDARRQIHVHLRRLADAGAAIVFVSTDLEELIALADRIAVLRGGRIGQELSPLGLSPEQLLAAIQAPEGSHVP